MSLSAIVHIADRLLSRDLEQNPQNQGKSKPTQGNERETTNRTEFGDRFTSSAQSGAGNQDGETALLQVEQLRFTSVNIQTAGGNGVAPASGTAGTATVGEGTVVANAGGTPAAATTNAATPPATVTPTATAPTAALATGAVNTATATAATQSAATPAAPASPQTQQELQTLNSALAALGLNAAEIAAFDQFASVLLQFSPNALQDLQNQLALLASQFQTQNAATPAAPQSPPAPSFQLNELSVSFTGLQGTLNQTSANGGASTATSLSAFNLQVKEVSVTLSNPAGQTTQVTVPQAASSAPATAPAAQTANAAAAKAPAGQAAKAGSTN